jgi:hypothetical protein
MKEKVSQQEKGGLRRYWNIVEEKKHPPFSTKLTFNRNKYILADMQDTMIFV